MLPIINGKSLMECAKEDFEVIIENPDYRENEYIDYKRSFAFLEFQKNDPRRDEHIAEFRSDVCAFANAEGGYLIFGVSDKKGLADELVGIEIPNNNTDKFELERKNNLQSILPKIPSVKFRFVLLDNGKYLVILLIQKDGFSPYIHLHNEKDYKIYKRVGNGKSVMSYSEMKMQFSQSLSLAQEIERFRKERIDYFRSIEDDNTQSYSRFVLLHIIPDTFLDSSHNKQIYVINRLGNNKVGTIFAPFPCAEFPRPNVDGIHLSEYSGKSEGQVYNNCIAECFVPAMGYYLYTVKSDWNNKSAEFFSYESLWDSLRSTVDNYANTFSQILDTRRFFVCLTIVGCRGVMTSNIAIGSQRNSKIDRSIMAMAPVVFENVNDTDNVSFAAKRLYAEFRLALGLSITKEEMQELYSGAV